METGLKMTFDLLFVVCDVQQQVMPKKKLEESAAEPHHVEIYLSTRSIDLYLSAVVDFCQCELAERDVYFRDTLMFQTRIHKYVLWNIMVMYYK